MNKERKKQVLDLLFKTAPADLEEIADKLSVTERSELEQALEGIGEKAVSIAGYFDMRYGYGCGDQGHKDAVKQFNRNGKLVHCKIFGYNTFLPIHF